MKKFILLVCAAVFVGCAAFIYAALDDTVYKKTESITSSDGERFKAVYEVKNFPDESYSINIYGTDNEFRAYFSGDGARDGREVIVNFLYSDERYRYYEAVLIQYGTNVLRTKIFTEDKER